MKPVVEVKGVSKKYSRNANSHLGYGMTDLLDELLGRKRSLKLRQDEFWAVKDLDLTLERGDSFALIGRNGSGKSTLLKMMYGVVKPDTGSITLRGRVQALINLGAGFNGALSGLENIYGAASIMGLNSAETRAILDDIIGFAELEEFIESPVNTYSSGMKARLGFAVAIHLKPDILFIDEILAVGDHAFQNKCFLKMQELKREGVTMVLVSHSHTQVIQLCKRALWIHRGEMQQMGATKDVVESYLAFLEDTRAAQLLKESGDGADGLGKAPPAAVKQAKAAPKDKKPEAEKPEESGVESLYGPVHEAKGITRPEVTLLSDGEAVWSVPVHGELTVRYTFEILDEVEALNVSLKFFRKDGLDLTTISTLRGDLLADVRRGPVACEVTIRDMYFAPGEYVLVMPVHEGHGYRFRDKVAEFLVTGQGMMCWGLTDFDYEYRVIGKPGVAP